MLNFQMEHNELKTSEDFQRLVDAINAILCMDTDVEAQVVTSTHQKYHQAVKLVNDRLKQCDQLLQKGLRAEALQLANIEPKLLDVVAILDFDEQELWNDYAQRCGFTRVPELLVDFADDLETAWADEEPLTDLRYRHRLHALARSPLPVRIDILRLLAKADQNNPLWGEELQIYERARLADLAEECKAAAASDDLERIRALESELKSGGWRVTPPPKLVGFAAAKSKEIQGKYARAQLAQLEPLLNEAYTLLDVETARTLRDQWGRHAAVAQLSEQDPLLLQVAEPLNWLDEKDRQDRELAAYLAAIKGLESALDRRDVAKADFESLYYKIEQFGRGMPENLQQRLALRVEELDRQAARQRTLKMLGISAGTIALLILVGVAALAYNRNAELARHIANLQGLIEAEQLDQAEEYASNREADTPRVYHHPDFQSVVRDLESAVQADEDRRSQLSRLIAEAEDVRDGLSLDDPSTLAPIHVNQGYESLKLANDIAKTDNETARVKELLDELNAKVTQVQTAVDDRYRAEVSTFEEALRTLDPDAPGYAGTLNAQRNAGEVLKDRKWISPDLGMRLMDPLLTRIDGLIEQDQLARAEETVLKGIQDAIGNANLYRLKLNEYLEDPKFAGTPRQRHFQQVLQNETALWVGFEAWSRLKSELQSTNLAKYNPDYAPQLIKNANDVLKQHKGFPHEAAIQSGVEYLNILVVRDGDSLQTAVRNIVGQDIVDDLYMLQTKDKKYYSQSPPAPVGTTKTHFRILAATDIDLDEEKSIQFRREEIKNPLTTEEPGFDFVSPQTKFSELAKEKMAALSQDATNWERDFLELLTALHNDKTMDDFVRFKLIESIETIACSGSLYLKQELKEDLDTIAKVQAEIDPNANWINPDDQNGKKEREEAGDALRRFEDPQEALKGLEAYHDKWKQIDLGPDYEWVGWLHRGRKNQWMVSYAKAPAIKETPVKLHVLIRRTPSSPATFTPIGELRNGQAIISVADGSPALLEGRPVFEEHGK